MKDGVKITKGKKKFDDEGNEIHTYARFNSDANLFSIRIIDEAHKLSNRYSQQSRATRGFAGASVVLVTATPIKNELRDLGGLLDVLYQKVSPAMTGVANPTLDEIDALHKEFISRSYGSLLDIADKDLENFLVTLSPNNFRHIAGAHGTSEFDLQLSRELSHLTKMMDQTARFINMVDVHRESELDDQLKSATMGAHDGVTA